MTDEELVQRILTQARGEVESRQIERASAREVQAERPWLYAFIGLALVLIGGVMTLPGPLSEKLHLVVHGVCAQQHHIVIGGVNMPLCARNTGIYSGAFATLLYLLAIGRGRAAKLPSGPITATLLALILIMAFDGFNSLFLDIGVGSLYTPRNDVRTITGLGMGVAVGVFMLFAINNTLLARPRTDQRVLGSWAELVGAVLVNALLFGMLYGLPLLGVNILYYPLAIFSVLGITGVLFAVNVLVIAVLARHEGTLVRLSQIAKPGTLALVLTVGELALLALARASIESGITGVG